MSFFSRMFIGTDREFQGIELDAILTEQYEFSSTLTEHPTDAGGDVADHIIRNPRGYIFEGVVTDTPMGLLQAVQNLGDSASAALNFLRENVLGAEAEQAPVSRSMAAFQALVQLWSEGRVFDVQTGYGLVTDLAILNMQVRVDEETAGHLRFVARLRQIPRVQVAPDEEAQNLGPEVAEGAEPAKKEGLKQKVSTLATSVTNSVKEFFK
jgi:hypothetical protein